jgi:hypothetical protein
LEIFEHKDEYFFVKESLNSKAIPAPNCWSKITRRYTMTVTTPKLGYMGIKKIMDDAGINYTRKPII